MADIDVQQIIALLRHDFAVSKESHIAGLLQNKLSEASSSLDWQLLKDNPFRGYSAMLTQSKKSFLQGEFQLSDISSDLKSYIAFSNEFNIPMPEKEFWGNRMRQVDDKNLRKGDKKKREKIKNERKALRGLLLEQWEENLDKARAAWEMEKIREFQRRLIKELQDWLKLLQELADVLSLLCIQPGRFFDLSKGELSFSDIEEIKKWVAYLKSDKGAQKLCEMLGRLQRAERIMQQRMVSITDVIYEPRPDVHSREEIIGVKTGNQVEHALAMEKCLLMDEDVEMLFYLKLAENRLMQFEMQGMVNVEKIIQKERLEEYEEEEKNGPVIICVDTSGSMHGIPETIAKAIAMYLSTQAASAGRDCYLINFSTDIETLDLSGTLSLPNLVKFLKASFHGGTDVAPAIEHALKTMQKENYKKSDLLVISDFLMSDLPEQLTAGIIKARENENRFFSLAVGDVFMPDTMKEVFDGQWVYNPHTGNDEQLVEIAKSVV